MVFEWKVLWEIAMSKHSRFFWKQNGRGWGIYLMKFLRASFVHFLMEQEMLERAATVCHEKEFNESGRFSLVKQWMRGNSLALLMHQGDR